MNSSTLRWLCALGCLCMLALVKPPATKRSAIVSNQTSIATVHRPSGPALQPVPTAPRFLVPDPAPGPDSVGIVYRPATEAPRFLVSHPGATPLAQPADAPQLLASIDPVPLPQKDPVQPFLPVVLSAALPEPGPTPQFLPTVAIPTALEPAPAAVPGKGLPPVGSGLNGLPELSSDGYWIENAPLNEIFQYLARRAESQYFFNNELTGPEYSVTGHLKLTDPMKQMEDLAIAYGLTVHQQGGTTYLMTESQLSRLPIEVLCYSLKYLRGAHPKTPISKSGAEGEEGGHEATESGAGAADFTKLMSIIRPILTKGSGHIEFEEKNNVLLVTDSAPKIKKVRAMLEQIDRPKDQIVINVRILRVRKSKGSRIGVDWNNILGEGLPVSASQSLNAVFGLPDSSTLTKTLLATKDLRSTFTSSRDTLTGTGLPPNVTTTTNDTFTRDIGNSSANESFRQFTDGAGLVFDALQMEAIVHALRDCNIVTQEACPTLVTEDNEQGIISIVDRFPLITTDIVATTSTTNITDKVRYKIDEEDPNAAEEPEKSREIGVTLSVTPTLLPDGTVRMRLRPRVANIVEFVTGPSGNIFPRVSESTIEGISRIPQGKSLVLGGFYDSNDTDNGSKIPFLGSLPLINKLFSYKDKLNEQISLIFVITPRIYDASRPEALPAVNAQVQLNSGFNRPDSLGPATPLLPEPAVENAGFPNPIADRDSIPSAKPERKQSWFGRVFSKRPRAAEIVVEPVPPVGPSRY